MKLLVIALAMVGFSATSFAAGSAATTGLKGDGMYGNAGCGLGSMVFGKQEGPVQILAATTNGTSGSQTFGITSGTSNCGKGVFAKAEINAFIQSNAVALESDIARGQGETLSTLNNMLNCDSQFGQTLQQNYKSIYSSGVNSSEKIQVLAQSCQG